MSESRNQDRAPKQRETRTRPPEWEADLHPNHHAGQKVGEQSDERIEAEWEAFHLRKRGMDLGGMNGEALEQVPVGEPKPGQE